MRKFIKENPEGFIELLDKKVKRIHLNSDSDWDESLYIIDEDFIYNNNMKPIVNRFKVYLSYNCNCEHDCCGHRSSQTIDVINNKNGYTSIFIRRTFNF